MNISARRSSAAAGRPTLSILLVDTVKSGNHWPKASVIAITMIVTLTLILFAAIKFAYHKSAGVSRD